ncbi:MAG: ATP-binding protein [Sneathiella sp.]|nr:ATP-binding protein [Sneathiella sp.]
MKDPKQNSEQPSGCHTAAAGSAALDYPYLSEDELAHATKALFRFRTLKEARFLCDLVSSQTFDPIIVGIGLIELMVNAIEHGNLEITYEEKGLLLKKGEWQKEVERRLELPEYKSRYATLEFNRSEKHLDLLITDEGDGFDADKFLHNQTHDREESTGSQYHGRGIAVASQLDFEKIEYLGKGNQVRVSILTK